MAQAFDLPWLIAEGRAHWKAHLSALYNRLKNQGRLEQELKNAAEQTLQEMQELQKKAGMTPAEAWPEVRAMHLILDPTEYGKAAP